MDSAHEATTTLALLQRAAEYEAKKLSIAEHNTEHQATKETEKDYSSIANTELIELMFNVLHKNIIFKDPNHYSVDKERITDENWLIIENIMSKAIWAKRHKWSKAKSHIM